MSTIRAVVVDPSAPQRLAIRDVAAPTPLPSEALVQVAAISLNLGEVRRTTTAEAGWRPGWDFAGVVEQSAADGTGPKKGARVVGMLGTAAWAELIAAPTNNLAELPQSVSLVQAATLPVAGLTAYRALSKGGLLLGHRVLITGATGGVGHFAVQLARQAGAYVVGTARRPERAAIVSEAGAHQVVIGEDLEATRRYGPYHLILDSVGGQVLGQALSMLAPDSTCVNFGASGSAETTFETRQFFATGGANFYGFILFHELARKAGAEDLGILANLVADGRLRPTIDR
ncbi:MAG TPA: zinc-binding dehydrogenase, partial [Ktedonobacteraceae bacterium]